MLLSYRGWMPPILGDMIAQLLLPNIRHNVGVVSVKKGTKVTEYRNFYYQFRETSANLKELQTLIHILLVRHTSVFY